MVDLRKPKLNNWWLDRLCRNMETHYPDIIGTYSLIDHWKQDGCNDGTTTLFGVYQFGTKYRMCKFPDYGEPSMTTVQPKFEHTGWEKPAVENPAHDKGATNVYFQSARRTGRTTSLVDSLKNGDRVVFLSEREGRRVQSLCKERGVEIEVIVNDPKSPDRLFGRGSPHGDVRTIFDHSWVKQFYLDAIARAQRDVDRFERELSGRGAAHRETKRQADEFSRWKL